MNVLVVMVTNNRIEAERYVSVNIKFIYNVSIATSCGWFVKFTLTVWKSGLNTGLVCLRALWCSGHAGFGRCHLLVYQQPPVCAVEFSLKKTQLRVGLFLSGGTVDTHLHTLTATVVFSTALRPRTASGNKRVAVENTRKRSRLIL